MGSVTVELEVKMTVKHGYIFIKKDKTGTIIVADQKGKILCKKDISPAGLFKTKVNVADLEIEANKIFTTNDAKQSPWVSKIHIGSYKKLDVEIRLSESLQPLIVENCINSCWKFIRRLHKHDKTNDRNQ